MYQPATTAQPMKYLAADGEKRGQKKKKKQGVGGVGVVGGGGGGQWRK